MKIELLLDHDIDYLKHDINVGIANGWKMQGGIVPSCDGDGYQYYAQTMIKEEEVKK